MDKVIRIECEGQGYTAIDNINEFQGNLKDLSVENYEKLKRQILKLGFSEPISVWKNEEKLFALNGHQRLRTLRTMREEGFVIPKIPVNIVQAKDIKQAKEKVLSLTSQYGQITDQGLYEFLHEADLDFNFIKDDLRFPEIDFDKFDAEFIREIEAQEGALPDLNATDPGCQQVTFILSNEQKDIMDEALEKAKKTEDCADELNQNSNGNALSAILRKYVGC
jgi:hypothetical protein